MSRCTVPGCKTAGGKLRYYLFPLKRPAHLKKWLRALNMDEYTPTHNSKVCSRHFSKSDFVKHGKNIVVLKFSAVPRVVPGTGSIRMGNSAERGKINTEEYTSSLRTPNIKHEEIQSTLHQTKLPDGTLCELFLTSDGSNSNDTTLPLVELNSLDQRDFHDCETSMNDENAPTSYQTESHPADHDYSCPNPNASFEDSNSPSDSTKSESRPLISENESVLSKFSWMLPKVDKESQTEVTLHHIYNDVVRYQRELFKLKKKLEETELANEKLRKALVFIKNGPGHVGTSNKTSSRIRGNQIGGRAKNIPNNNGIPTKPDDIWDINEIDEVASSDDVISDPRDRPVVEIVYKQKIGTEDVYLQMNNRSPLTSSCELMIITVTMKGEKRADIDCNVTETNVDIRSPLYRLHLPLPHPIKLDTANAEWDPSAQTLVLTLELVRDLDGVNF